MNTFYNKRNSLSNHTNSSDRIERLQKFELKRSQLKSIKGGCDDDEIQEVGGGGAGSGFGGGGSSW